MPDGSKNVAVVDDDESVREALPDLLRSFGLSVQAYSSAYAFLESDAPNTVDGLILDVAMPGMTGPELEVELRGRARSVPVIFITAIADEKVRQRLIRGSAVTCLFKPFSDEELENALRLAALIK
ncbi:response regulator [Sinorhizobium meliloti]|uniref:response regulator n=1 Tax=Rhizobium meliloti TaxID=382 RepID=UPI000B49CA23|nr:response regulator [Sinorhizobium meliloti]ASP98462.1 two-component system response regulator [Sinorhizobium meliloti]MQV66208.1 response regulator [Sinorhizobium meliloti]RVQ39305.1 response regulator [Sinorhizobium meliloti]